MYNDSLVFCDKSDKITLKRKLKETTFQQQKLKKNDQIQCLEMKLHHMEEVNDQLKNEITQLSLCNSIKSLSINFDITFSDRIKYIIDRLKQSSMVRDNVNSNRRSGFFIINASSYFFPIIFASPELLTITKYQMHEIIGQNCGFLCGSQTSRLERAKLNEALQEGRNISTILLNYRKDNTMFWNYLQLEHVHEHSNSSNGSNVFKPFMIVGYHTELNPYIDGNYELDHTHINTNTATTTVPHSGEDNTNTAEEHHIIKDIILRYKENGVSKDDLTSIESSHRNNYCTTNLTPVNKHVSVRQQTASNVSLLTDATTHSSSYHTPNTFITPPSGNNNNTHLNAEIIVPKAVTHVMVYKDQGIKQYSQQQPTTFYNSCSIDDLLKPIQSAAIIPNTSTVSYKETTSTPSKPSTLSLAALKEKLCIVTTSPTNSCINKDTMNDERSPMVRETRSSSSSILTNLSKASAFTKVQRNHRFIASCTPVSLDTTTTAITMNNYSNVKKVSFDSSSDDNDCVPLTSNMIVIPERQSSFDSFVSTSPDHCFELSYLHSPHIITNYYHNINNSSSYHNINNSSSYNKSINSSSYNKSINSEVVVSTTDNTPDDFEIFSEFLDSEEYDANCNYST